MLTGTLAALDNFRETWAANEGLTDAAEALKTTYPPGKVPR
jgi:hypothetical protein